jgi:hypothetical protein
MVGTISTPWPAFLICCNNSVSPHTLASFQSNLSSSISSFSDNFDAIGLKFITTNSALFHYPGEKDVQAWFSKVSFNRYASQISRDVIQDTVATLIEAGLICGNKLREWEAENGCVLDCICHKSVTFI